MNIRIRSAGIDDLHHLLHHRRAMFEEMGYRDEATLDHVDEVSRRYFTQALPAGAYRAWLAEGANREVVGGGGIVLAAWPGYPGESLMQRAWILNMYTEPEARRCGVAKKILAVMLEWCRVRGFGCISLHASVAGRPLYETLGFQQSNEMTLKLR